MESRILTLDRLAEIEMLASEGANSEVEAMLLVALGDLLGERKELVAENKRLREEGETDAL